MKTWSERLEEALDLAYHSDPVAVPLLVNLLFENPIPLSEPILTDEEVSKLLKYPGRAPKHEVKAVKIAVAYQKWVQKCLRLVSQVRSVLQTFPNCALKDKILDLTIKAAGFELVIENADALHSHISPDHVHHLNIRASGGEGEKNVDELCNIVHPLTTNILHKVANKRDIIVRSGICTSFDERIISFSKEREIAKKELSRRGNPPYDPKAYFL